MTTASGPGADRRGRGLVRVLPVVEWLPRYERRWLRGDVAAGIAVTALIVPKNLGYAGIAGVPLQNGLYAAAAGGILYALFCTSRHISTGPSSSLAAVAGGAVVVTGLAGEQAAQLVAAIAVATGLLFLLLALLRMGWIASFLSKAVVTGFLAGAAVDVVIGELPKLTGTSADGDNAWRELGSWLGSLGDVHGTTVLVGVSALAVILGLRRLAPAVPGALVLVAGGLLASYLFDLGAHGVALVGDVPRGLPAPAVPDLALVRDHYATIAHRGARAAADRVLADGRRRAGRSPRATATASTSTRSRSAQGMANVGAGLFQGMPVSTSLSASSLNESAGARTQVSSLTTGGLVLATLVVLAPLFSELPKAVLGRRDHRRRRVRHDRRRRAAAPLPGHALRLLGRGGGDRRRPLGRRARRRRDRGRPVARAGSSTSRRDRRCRCSAARPGPRSTATSTRTRATRRSPASSSCASTAASSSPPPRRSRIASAPWPRTAIVRSALVLDLEGVNFVDSQGAAKVTEIHQLTRGRRRHAEAGPASSRRCAPCCRPTESSTASAPTTSTATSTARSRHSWQARVVVPGVALWTPDGVRPGVQTERNRERVR